MPTELGTPAKTNEQVLAESTAVAQNAAKVAGLGTFQQGVGLQPGQFANSGTPTQTLSQPPAPSTTPINLGNMSSSFSSNALTQPPRTFFDIQSLIAQNNKAREAYLQSLAPTAQEQDLGTQLANIRKSYDDFNLSLDQGKQAEYGMGRPLALSTGRAQELERQAGFQKQDFANQEKNLLTRLGLAQEARQAQTNALGKAVEFGQQDFDMAMKVEDRIRQQESDIFNRAIQMNTLQRQQFADILDTFKGADPRTLPAQSQAQLAQIAAQRGIPFDMVMQGLESVYNQDSFDRLYKQNQMRIQNAELGIRLQELGLKQSDLGTPADLGNMLAYAQQYAATGQIPTGLPKGSFGIVSQLAQQLPKRPGTIVDAQTGVKSSALGSSQEQGLIALYDIEKKIRDARSKFSQMATGLIPGAVGSLFPSAQRQSYNTLRNEIVDLIARARTGAVINDQEAARYGKLLPSDFSNSFFVGSSGSQKLTDLDSLIRGKLDTSLDAFGVNIIGRDTSNQTLQKAATFDQQ